jgi:hypothetical protein
MTKPEVSLLKSICFLSIVHGQGARQMITENVLPDELLSLSVIGNVTGV